MRKLLFVLSLPLFAQDPIPFSKLVADLSANPEFVEAFIQRLDKNPAVGGILGPEQIQKLRGHIAERRFEALDTFPGITLKTLSRGVRLAGKVVSSETKPPVPAPASEDWGFPPKGITPLKPDAFLSQIGPGLTFGDELDPKLAPVHADSVRLSEVLNRLAVYGGEGYRLKTPWGDVSDPSKLIEALQRNKHSVEIRDSRYFANFGDLRYKDRDVLTPFWLDTGIKIPGTDRTLLFPAPHSQHELRVEGPNVNAAICFFFGIDGKAVFRPIDTKDQAWVQGRTVHVYRDGQAASATGIIGDVIRVYAQIQKANPGLPFGGYFALGVCNDPNAIVEYKLNGATTLYPLTHDKSLFEGHGEITDIVKKLPNDAEPGGLDRILASIPAATVGDLQIDFLRNDLMAVQRAPVQVERSRSWLFFTPLLAVLIALAARRRRLRRQKNLVA